MLKKSDDFNMAFLDYRHTPLEGINKSPAQLRKGRRLQFSIPARAELLKDVSNNKDTVEI
ncbi:hypothetical protein DPMN_091099 [Dreissena polymorpha]|uniref:Uncharacterized protein n=1 Tax=Dreissena polymorpha TaxID=45954 RepID=A0A9D4L009_DREPO|nr:hypothetical protein DPMN_091099 [Dreissena polymorpha]